MARTIEARVIQKVATEAEWLNVALPLYNGEIALVRSGDRVVNMKVGNGTSKFSELNYVYNGGFNGSINPSTATTELQNGFYIAEVNGTYNNAGGIVVKEGYYTVLEKYSGGWKKSTEVKMPMQDLTPLENRISLLENINTKYTTENLRTKNLFNTNDVLKDTYQPSQVSNLVTTTEDSGWWCSNYIAVNADQKITISGNKNRLGVGFYDANKQCIGYNSTNIGTITTPANCTYIVINLTNDNTQWSNVMVELSDIATSYVPYLKIKKSNVEGLVEVENSVSSINTKLVDYDHAKDVTQQISAVKTYSTNLVNPDLIILNTLISDTTGELITTGASADYNTFYFIKISPSTSYRAINTRGTQSMRKVAFYDANKSFVSGLNNVNTFTSPANAEYVRYSILNTNVAANQGLFLFEVTSFEYYYATTDYRVVNNLTTDRKLDNSLANIKDIKNLIKSSGSLVFTKNSSVLKINNPNGSITFNLDYGRNLVANFTNTSYKGVNVNNTDDVAPAHVMGTTLGANHGQGYNIATISVEHGLDNSFVGTEWTHSNGLKYILIKINSTTSLSFFSVPTGTRENYTITAIPTGTITRSDKTFTISSVVADQYPGAFNKVVKVLSNGNEEITSDGTYYAEFLDIIESYSFINFYDLVQNLILNQGTLTPNYAGGKMFTVYNHYRFDANGNCIVNANFNTNQSLVFKDFMFSQAVKISTSNEVVSYYIPNSLPINGYDFRKPLVVEWSTSVPALSTKSSNWADQNNPVNRIIQYFNNTGFIIGFLKDYGVGKKLQDFTISTFDIRNNTGKVYPHGVEGSKVGTTLNENTAYNAVIYRAYTDLEKTRKDGRLSMFNFEYNKNEYVILDYSASMYDIVEIKDSLNGKKIEVVESSNCTLVTDVYNNNLIVNSNYIEGQTSFIVLNIK